MLLPKHLHDVSQEKPDNNVLTSQREVTGVLGGNKIGTEQLIFFTSVSY